VFLAIIADGIVGDRAGRIKEDIIRSPKASHAKLLHDLGGKLIWRPVATARLREEGVVVITAIDEEGVVYPANTAEG